MEWAKILVNDISDKEFIFKIYKEIIQLIREEKSKYLILKRTKSWLDIHPRRHKNEHEYKYMM